MNNTNRECIEPIWYLKSIPYSEYRQSRYWRRRAESYKENLERGIRCELCGMRTVDTADKQHEFPPRFHVHHRSYDNLGEELDSDLILLCSACHNAVHSPTSIPAQFWVRYLGERQTITWNDFEVLKPGYLPSGYVAPEEED